MQLSPQQLEQYDRDGILRDDRLYMHHYKLNMKAAIECRVSSARRRKIADLDPHAHH